MPLWPLGVYFIAVLAVVAVMLGMPQLLGERHRERATTEPYESGAPPTGTARTRISAQYYLVAMLFVVLDIEAVFLFAWAVAARDLGWSGYVAAAIFTGVLGAALAYLWRVGALDWTSSRRRGTPRPAVASPRPRSGAVASRGAAGTGVIEA